MVPTTFRVLVTRRPHYGCRSCEGAVVQAPAPARIVERGLPTEALIAQVLVEKYADHVPLFRQAQIYARQNVRLDRSTLADWVGRAAWYLRPLRDHVLGELRRSERLFADENTAPVLDPGRGRKKWVSYGPMLVMIGRGAVTTRRWSPMFTPPTARPNGPRRISRILQASFRSTAMAATLRSPCGDNWAVIATLIENCKLSGINPHDWLTRTLTKFANGHPANDVGNLMPWRTAVP